MRLDVLDTGLIECSDTRCVGALPRLVIPRFVAKTASDIWCISRRVCPLGQRRIPL